MLNNKECVQIYHTSIASDVNQCLGKCRVKCSSTMAIRGENSRRAFSIATALEGNTTTFLQKNFKNKEVKQLILHSDDKYDNASYLLAKEEILHKKKGYILILAENKNLHIHVLSRLKQYCCKCSMIKHMQPLKLLNSA